MIRPCRRAHVIGVCCLSLFMLVSVLQAQQPQRPNVLLIAIDDLNDWVGFLQGHPQVRTPHMDRLARRGVIFANAHCAAPLCCPSRAAVFSGLLPAQTGVYNNRHNVRRQRPNVVLIPQHFKQHGYRVHGTGKLLHRHAPELFDSSFFPQQRWSPLTRTAVQYTPQELPSKGTSNPRHVAAWDGHAPVVLPLNRMPSDRRPNQVAGESFDWGPFDIPDSAMGDGQIVDWAVERINATNQVPFFLAVGFYRPHIPLWAPRKYFDMYPVKSTILPAVREGDLDDLRATGRRWALEAVTAGSHKTVLRFNQWKHAVAAYLACVTFVDAQIGRLLDALDRSPHADTTHIVLWSDHGWHLGEKQHWGKWTGWERSTRVPLVVIPSKKSSDRFQVGSVCRQPVSLIDLYPTLIELCRLGSRDGLDGQSLVRLLRQPDQNTGRAVVTTFDEGNHAVRDAQWRYIRYADGSEELYDLQADAHEWTNLAQAGKYTSVIQRMRTYLPERNKRARTR